MKKLSQQIPQNFIPVNSSVCKWDTYFNRFSP